MHTPAAAGWPPPAGPGPVPPTWPAPVTGFPRRVRKVGAPLGVLIALATLVGLIVIALSASNPLGASLGFVLSTLGISLVVAAFLWLDRWEPEPPRLLLLAFLWGASVAVVLSVVLGLLFEALVNPGGEGISVLSVALGAPLVEEAAKGLFLLLMLTGRRRRYLNSLADCIVYGGIVAAGFSWLEDILYIASGETLGESLITAGLRLVMAPFAHSLFTMSVAVGVYFALQQRTRLGKAGAILLGYAGAVVLHGLWNGSALLSVGAYLAVYALWMVPIFGLAVWVAVDSRRREQQIVAGKLAGMVAAGVVTANEATWLGSIAHRKAAVRTAARLGRPAGRAVSGFAGSVVELAFVRDRIDRGVDRRFSDVLHRDLHEATYAVYAARAQAGFALRWLVNYRATPTWPGPGAGGWPGPTVSAPPHPSYGRSPR